MLIGETSSAERGAGVLKYVLIVTVVALIGYYFLNSSRPTDVSGSLQEITADLEQSLCEVLNAMDCSPTFPWEPHEPDQLEWDESNDETCVLRLCW